MSRLNNNIMFDWLKIGKKSSVEEREVVGSPRVVMWTSDDYLNYFSGRSTDLAISTVFCCVDLLSKKVANLPMMYMRKRDGIFVEDENSPLAYLLNVQPNEFQSAYDFWCGIVQAMLLEGNAYVVPMRNYAGDIERFMLCSPNSVTHDLTTDTYTVDDSVTGLKGVFSQEDILHIKNISIDGRTGVSTLSYARTALDTAMQGDRETLTRFTNGGNVRGIVSNDMSVKGFGEYQDEQLQALANKIDQKINIDGHRIVGMAGQVNFQQMSLSSVDMQFLESRKFEVREICRFFRVHPSLVFDDTSNNYKSAEMANSAFLSDTLNPILRKIENEFLRKLVAPSLSMKRKFMFNREDLLICDLESKADYQTKTIAAGVMTVNEWRRKENKEQVAGGDKVYLSANLKSIDELNNANTLSNAE